MKNHTILPTLLAALCLLAACSGEAKQTATPSADTIATTIPTDSLPQTPQPQVQTAEEEPSEVVDKEETIDDAPPTEG